MIDLKIFLKVKSILHIKFHQKNRHNHWVEQCLGRNIDNICLQMLIQGPFGAHSRHEMIKLAHRRVQKWLSCGWISLPQLFNLKNSQISWIVRRYWFFYSDWKGNFWPKIVLQPPRTGKKSGDHGTEPRGQTYVPVSY